jgi:DNA (cytosine-5)-methyltransferase 1
MLFEPIPVVDLFAGPGGLGEGFSSLTDSYGNRIFDVRVSIEKDPNASETLKLRAFFRAFPQGKVPDCYYEYLRGNIEKNELITNPLVREEWEKAGHEAHQATLGETPHEIIDQWIHEAIGHHDTWVLIGGPPCQAYSIVGRSRMRGADPGAFENDKRHFLYKEYLRIIQKFKPAVFVMENVKGLLSSTHGGAPIFDRIFEDLSRPEQDLQYEIQSFVRGNGKLKPNNFVIEAEKYGIPQRRHRVILFGVRRGRGHADKKHRPLIEHHDFVNVRQILSGMPKIRSRLSLRSPKPDSLQNWLETLKSTPGLLSTWQDPYRCEIEEVMNEAIRKAQLMIKTGTPFDADFGWSDSNMPAGLKTFIGDPELEGVCQHQTRSHMPGDLHRRVFLSVYPE